MNISHYFRLVKVVLDCYTLKMEFVSFLLKQVSYLNSISSSISDISRLLILIKLGLYRSQQPIKLQTILGKYYIGSASKNGASIDGASKDRVSIAGVNKDRISITNTSKDKVGVASISKDGVSIASVSKDKISIVGTSKDRFYIASASKDRVYINNAI